MPHLVLLGDSIFDNRPYVNAGEAVIDHCRRLAARGTRATLLAVDGSVVHDVPAQLKLLPNDATHLALSIGGNDALAHAHVLEERIEGPELMGRLAQVRDDFQARYTLLREKLLAIDLPLLVCTIYDSVPLLPREAHAALALFNDVILRCAIQAKLPVLDLRFTCDDADDYSAISPIEPSRVGGEKIARRLVAFAESNLTETMAPCAVFY